VVLNEATNATRNQNTTTSRATVNTAFPSIQAGISNGVRGLGLLGLGSAVNQVKADANTLSSDGSEKAGQYQSLTGSIAVTIVEVFSNGNLAVRGEKKLALNEGPEVIQVSGIIRIEDIAPDGTVQSKRLSNAQIAYRGSGEGADASRGSWGTRAMYKYWPF
jgi:flagellar L-ring protein precursor FlgH